MPRILSQSKNGEVIIFVISAVAVFLASLRNFYFDNLGGSVPSFISVPIFIFLSILCFYKYQVKISFTKEYIATLFLIAVTAMVHAVVVFDGYSSKAAAGFLLGGAMFASTYVVFFGRWNLFAKVLGVVLLSHILFYFIQIAVYFLLDGFYLDYVSLSDDRSRWFSSKAYMWDGQQIPRFTGLFAEPGTYSGTIGAIAAARLMIVQKIDFICVLAVITLLVSASMTGYVLSFLIFCALLFFAARSSGAVISRRVVLGVAASFIVMVVLLVSAFFKRPMDTLAEDVAVKNFLWLLNVENFSLFGHRMDDIPSYVSIDYLGVWSSAYVRFGLFGLISVLLPFFGLVFFNPFLVGAILAAKLQVTFPLVFILMAATYGFMQDKKKSNSKP